MTLDLENATEDLVSNEIMESIASVNQIIIVGAGDSGSWVYRLLEHLKLNDKVVCFCDNYSAKWGKEKLGLRICSFEEAIIQYPKSVICLASMWWKEIKKQIIEYDANLENRIFNFLSTMGWETTNKEFVSNEKEYIYTYQDQFEKLSKEFSDEISRNTLEGLLNYRLTRNQKYIEKIVCKEASYFDKQLMDEKIEKRIVNEWFIDGGSFDGDTVKLFIEKYGKDRILHIAGFEIDSQNCERFKANHYGNHIVKLYERGLWNRSGEFFCLGGEGMSAQLDGNSDLKKCETIALDDLDLGSIGFIKMDLEGAEREALQGARNVIQKYKPILAVCAYHLQDDLLELIKIIKSMDAGYKLYLRHYMESSGDTIIYAIP